MIDYKTKVAQFGIVCVKETGEGLPHRRTLSPASDISTEPQEVKDVCNAAWTDEVVEAYEDHKAAQV